MADGTDSSILGLVKSVKSDATKLAKAQAELAGMEIRGSTQQVGAMGGLFAAAAAVGGMGGLFLLITIALGLGQLIGSWWAGFGIVTLVLLIVAAVCALVGKRKASTVKAGLPLTSVEWQRTQLALSGQPTTSLPAVRDSAAVSPRAK